jgi:hypothetical protein
MASYMCEGIKGPLNIGSAEPTHLPAGQAQHPGRLKLRQPLLDMGVSVAFETRRNRRGEQAKLASSLC